jgi:hypothetical protein
MWSPKGLLDGHSTCSQLEGVTVEERIGGTPGQEDIATHWLQRSVRKETLRKAHDLLLNHAAFRPFHCLRSDYVDWVAPPILPLIWVRPALGSGEEKYISFCCQYVFAGANHQAGFSPWRAIGCFNTMTTGKRRQAANRVQSQMN